jgi:Flp pilus assembly protein TadG
MQSTSVLTNSRPVLRSRAKEGGNALVEFSILCVVMFLISCGVADFARCITAANVAQAAAAAGTQYGALSPAHYNDLTSCQNAALADTVGYTGAAAVATQYCTCSVGGASTTCPPSCGTSTGQTYLKVVVTIPYTSMFNYPLLPNPISVSGFSVVRVQ